MIYLAVVTVLTELGCCYHTGHPWVQWPRQKLLNPSTYLGPFQLFSWIGPSSYGILQIYSIGPLVVPSWKFVVAHTESLFTSSLTTERNSLEIQTSRISMQLHARLDVWLTELTETPTWNPHWKSLIVWRSVSLSSSSIGNATGCVLYRASHSNTQ